MRCSKCGADVPEGFKFCNMCGQPFVAAPVVPQRQAAQRGLSWNKTIAFVLAVLFLVACLGVMGLAALYNYMSDRNLTVANIPAIAPTLVRFALPATWTPTSATSPIPWTPRVTSGPPSPVLTGSPTRPPTVASGPLANITVDSWEITVTRVTFAYNKSNPGGVEKAPHRAANIFMTIKNIGYSPDTFVAHGLLVVKDASGAVYEENILASSLVRQR